MKFIAIIPARYASTRFPAKPLAVLGGKPVIRRVYEQVAGVLDDAVVATDDERIYDAVVAFGGKAEMTSADHKSGTDRCWEAYLRQGKPYDVVVNVQGDEPFIRASQLEAVKRCFDDPATDIATLVKPFAEADGLAALENPNSPKVVLDAQSRAIYFSRSVIPLCLPHGGAACRHGVAAVHARKGRVARAAPLARKRLQDRRGHHRRRDHRHRHAPRPRTCRGVFVTPSGIYKMTAMKFIAGPCVIESAELLDTVAERLVAINKALGTDIIFKASFDKANRTSISSFRGPGLEQGLRMLADVRAKWGLRLLTDIHEAWQAAPVGEVVDVIQIPAFLCRQTDLLTAAARTGKTVNIKKAQFLSGLDMQYPYEKARDAGASEIWLTERGNIYGYNNLVVDFRNIPDMLRIAQTVVMDCTHSVQRPGGAGGTTGGNREFVPAMARAAREFGANGFFFEVHPCPDCARSDGPNMLQLDDLENLIKTLL